MTGIDILNNFISKLQEIVENNGGKLPDINLDNLSESYDYRGFHTAPSPDENAPLYDLELNGIFPGIYSANARKLYGGYFGNAVDSECFSVISLTHNKPNQIVTIYRAIPDFNYDVNKLVKKYNEEIAYFDRFNFFPQNGLASNMMGKYYDPQVGYTIQWDELQNKIYNEILNKIEELKKEVKPYEINIGDWVTISKSYAIHHGKTEFEHYKILSKKVRAKEVWSDGNSAAEYGYWKSGTINEELKDFDNWNNGYSFSRSNFERHGIVYKDEIDNFAEKYNIKNFILLKPEEDTIILDELVVQEKGKGQGTVIMKELCNWADHNKYKIVLWPAPIGYHYGIDDTTQDDLVKFYQKFGFEIINYIEGWNGTKRVGEMRREPKIDYEQLIKETVCQKLSEMEITPPTFFKTGEKQKEDFEKHLEELEEDLEYYHVDDASPEADTFTIGKEPVPGDSLKEMIELKVKELFKKRK